MEPRYVIHKAGETEEGRVGLENAGSTPDAPPEKSAENTEVAEKTNETQSRILNKKIKAECCCPESLKFKIFLSNVWINNHNSACPF
jgi:hypothetical protein